MDKMVLDGLPGCSGVAAKQRQASGNKNAKKIRRLHWLAIPASTQIFMAAPQNVGVGQRVQLHGLSTQQLNGAEGVVRDPLTDGRVGVAITSAAAKVLEKWPCCRIKLENLTLLPPRPTIWPAMRFKQLQENSKATVPSAPATAA
jgi:hypothetical protein